MILIYGIVIVLSIAAVAWACMRDDEEDAIRKGYQRENEADFQKGFDR